MNTTKEVVETKSMSPNTPVYFLDLTVENVRCFGERQTLDLSDGQGKPARWTIMLGDNGTGKTTLLQCLVGFQSNAWLCGEAHVTLVCLMAYYICAYDKLGF